MLLATAERLQQWQQKLAVHERGLVWHRDDQGASGPHTSMAALTWKAASRGEGAQALPFLVPLCRRPTTAPSSASSDGGFYDVGMRQQATNLAQTKQSLDEDGCH